MNPVPNDQRAQYALAVVEAFFAKIHQPERLMSCAEYYVLDGWMKRGVPLRVVLRALQDTRGDGRSLTYYAPSVNEAYSNWYRLMNFGGPTP